MSLCLYSKTITFITSSSLRSVSLYTPFYNHKIKGHLLNTWFSTSTSNHSAIKTVKYDVFQSKDESSEADIKNKKNSNEDKEENSNTPLRRIGAMRHRQMMSPSNIPSTKTEDSVREIEENEEKEPGIYIEEMDEETFQKKNRNFLQRISNKYLDPRREILPSVTGKQVQNKYHELPAPQGMFTRLMHAIQSVAHPTPVTEIPNYPWCLSTSISNVISKSTATESLLDKNAALYGVEEARRLLLYPAYDFPKAFLREAEQNIVEMFDLLSDPNCAKNVNSLLPLMSKRIAVEYCKGSRDLYSKGRYIKLEPLEQFNVTIMYVHFTYGPYPVPRNHIKRTYLGHSEFWIPSKFSDAMDADSIQDAESNARNEGCYFRVGIRTGGEIKCTVYDSETNEPIISDVRDSVDIEFITPHFDPWDPIYEHQADSTWKLKFRWRISDIDGFIKNIIENEESNRIKLDIENKGIYLPPTEGTK